MEAGAWADAATRLGDPRKQSRWPAGEPGGGRPPVVPRQGPSVCRATASAHSGLTHEVTNLSAELLRLPFPWPFPPPPALRRNTPPPRPAGSSRALTQSEGSEGQSCLRSRLGTEASNRVFSSLPRSPHIHHGRPQPTLHDHTGLSLQLAGKVTLEGTQGLGSQLFLSCRAGVGPGPQPGLHSGV